MKARGYIKQLMAEAGLTIREDTMGDIYGVLPGANPGAASVSTGSHCDAIPLAGAYDGTLGEPAAPRSAAPCCQPLRAAFAGGRPAALCWALRWERWLGWRRRPLRAPTSYHCCPKTLQLPSSSIPSRIHH